MLDNVILHNPRCSKSRQTLALLQERNIAIEIIEYLKTPPTVAQLQTICERLGVHPLDICRSKEQTFKDLGLSAQDSREPEQWLQILHEHPILIERPIVIYKGNVALGRPPENVLGIL